MSLKYPALGRVIAPTLSIFTGKQHIEQSFLMMNSAVSKTDRLKHLVLYIQQVKFDLQHMQSVNSREIH